jgi:hypothetical protein
MNSVVGFYTFNQNNDREVGISTTAENEQIFLLVLKAPSVLNNLPT